METKFEPQSMVYFFSIKFNYILYYYALMSLYFQLLEKKKKIIPEGNRSFMKDLFSFCPWKTTTLTLIASISLQKTCKVSSVLAAFEVYP